MGRFGTKTATALSVDEQRAECLRLYSEGMTVPEIAAHFGMSYGTAYNRVRDAIDSVKSFRVDEYRKVQDAQLDALTEHAIEHVTSLDPDISLKGMAVLLRIMERRARLHGLDAPTQVAVTGEVVTISDETKDRIEDARKRLEALTANAGKPALRAVEA